jgi:hypothetical protein
MANSVWQRPWTLNPKLEGLVELMQLPQNQIPHSIYYRLLTVLMELPFLLFRELLMSCKLMVNDQFLLKYVFFPICHLGIMNCGIYSSHHPCSMLLITSSLISIPNLLLNIKMITSQSSSNSSRLTPITKRKMYIYIYIFMYIT